MKLSLAIGALTWYPLSASFRIAKRAGFDGVELLCSPWLLALGPERIEKLSKRLDMPVLTVHAPLRFREVNPETLADDAGRALLFAAELSTCRTVTVHHPISAKNDDADTARWLNRLQGYRDRVATDFPSISIENRPHNNDDVPDQALDNPAIMRSVASEWDLGITLDLAHAASMELPLGNVLRGWLTRLDNVHLSDANERQLRGGLMNGFFRDHQELGKGVLPIHDILRFLGESGYDGPITLELNPLTAGAWCPLLAVRRLRRSVEMLRDSLARPHGATLASESSSRPSHQR